MRGGATKMKVRRKTKKKLGLTLMISSYFKSMFDPTFGIEDVEDEDDGFKSRKVSKSKMKGKTRKLGSGGGNNVAAHGSMFTGGTAGPVCGPNGCT